MEAGTRIKRDIRSTSGAAGKSLGGSISLPPDRAAEGGVPSEGIQVRAGGDRMREEQAHLRAGSLSSGGYPALVSTGFGSWAEEPDVGGAGHLRLPAVPDMWGEGA